MFLHCICLLAFRCLQTVRPADFQGLQQSVRGNKGHCEVRLLEPFSCLFL